MLPAELQDRQRYALLEEIPYAQAAEHAREHLRRRSWITFAYRTLNVLAVLLAGLLWNRSSNSAGVAFVQLLLGVGVGYLLLRPVHEQVHALAHRAADARAVEPAYVRRRLTATGTADRCVLSGPAFARIRLAPFLTINPILLAAALLVPPTWAVVAAGMLLLHLGVCAADIALVNFLWHHRRDEVLTYDDVAGRRTCFYRSLRRDAGAGG
jgi:hypothetical protein